MRSDRQRPLSLEVLAVKVQSDNDTNAFAEIERRQYRMLCHYLEKRGAGFHDAKSIANETLVELYWWLRSARFVPSRSSVQAITLRIARCNGKDQRRRATTRKKREEEFAAEMGADAQQLPSASSDADRHERSRLLHDCIAKLPPPLDGLMDMHIAGMTNIEIAEMSGLSESSVSRKLGKARELIEVRLKRKGLSGEDLS